jgi:hypothetical protein
MHEAATVRCSPHRRRRCWLLPPRPTSDTHSHNWLLAGWLCARAAVHAPNLAAAMQVVQLGKAKGYLRSHKTSEQAREYLALVLQVSAEQAAPAEMLGTPLAQLLGMPPSLAVGQYEFWADKGAAHGLDNGDLVHVTPVRWRGGRVQCPAIRHWSPATRHDWHDWRVAWRPLPRALRPYFLRALCTCAAREP